MMTDPKNEKSSLLPHVSVDSDNGENGIDPALASSSPVSNVLFGVQAILVVFFLFGTTYPEEEYSVKEYIAFRDIMAMLLLGFGYLMTFLKAYGLGAVGFTMLLSVVSMQLNIAMELLMRYLKGETGDNTAWPMPLSVATMVDAEFCAATLMITFGALIGRACPSQMLIIAITETFAYSFNKVFLVLGHIGAEDVGGSMTIHLFGAVFGLAASKALGPAIDEEAVLNSNPNSISDLFAFIGTTILWVFWPSFVGATETGSLENEKRCIINTICALLGSTLAAFWASHKLTHAKFDPVHIANSTLAGGVAIGSAGRLDIGPGIALVLGIAAGTISVVGYVHSTPYLEKNYAIQDTCGVGNLHGWPSLLGGLASIALVAVDPAADFLNYGLAEQMVRQFVAVIATIVVAALSGYGTGVFIHVLKDDSTKSYLDEVWWHAPYYETKDH